MPDRIIRAEARTRIVRTPQGRTRVVRSGGVSRVVVGRRGLRGPAGPPSAALDFEFVQASPASPWTVNHNLGVEPIITVLTAGGVEVDAEVVHVSDNQAMIYFKSPFAGRARCV